MGTATTSATLLSLALAGWLGAATVVAAAPTGRAAATQAPAPASPGAAPGEAADRAAPTARPAPPALGRERRRRISYASCNRESHRRTLRGGARRRFLIRCRLGYERRPAPAGQTGGPGQPPARRP